jgi:hypothetical protein
MAIPKVIYHISGVGGIAFLASAFYGDKVFGKSKQL